MRRATALTALTLAVALAGCGSSSAPVPSSRPAAGRALFSASCGGCHSLTGHGTPSQQGGDLLGLRLRRSVALQFAREMPVRRTLTKSQLGAIVDYIAAVQRANR